MTAVGAGVRNAVALLVFLLVGGLVVAMRGLSAFWILRREVRDSTRKPVFQGRYAQGLDVMAVLEAAKVSCELSPLDEHGQVEVNVRARDLLKARSALASRA